MRYSFLVPIAVLLVVLLICVPVADAQKATPQPTPMPPAEDTASGPEESKPPPQPTPTPEKVKPTSPPTPPPLTAVPDDPDDSEDKPTTQPAPAASPTPAAPTRIPPTVTPSASITTTATGQVFDDQDGDGIHDSNEPGVAGVPVMLDDQVVGVTDANGLFSLPGGRKALLSIVPPAGWQWRGAPLPCEDVLAVGHVAIAIQRLEEQEPAADEQAATRAATFTTGVAAVALLVVFAFDGIATLLQTRAIRAGNRRAAEIDLARLDALREQLERQVEVQPDEVVARLGRFALEATGERAGIDQVIRIVSRPVPAVVALGRDFANYVFTTAPPKVARRDKGGLLGDNPRRTPDYPIDASTSGLTAATELAAIWTLLASEQGIRPEERVLPRSARWYLYVVPQPTGERGLQWRWPWQ